MHGEASNVLRTKACQILRQKILRCLRISRKFCPAPHRINPPILSDYQIVTIFVTREEIDDLIQRNLFVKPDRGKWNDEIEAQMLSALVALRKAIQKFPISHAISPLHRLIENIRMDELHQNCNKCPS